MQDPYAHLPPEEILRRAEIARRENPFLYRLAEFVVFTRDPREWVRNWTRRRAIARWKRRWGLA
jgi:hypothetical protein